VQNEYVNKWQVFERDGWICGLCHEPVDREAKWPDWESPSLDHIVPLAVGGPHIYENVQCAHLGCNLIKNDGRKVRPRLITRPHSPEGGSILKWSPAVGRSG